MRSCLGLVLTRATITPHNHASAFSNVSTWLRPVEKVYQPNQPRTVFPNRTRKHSTNPGNEPDRKRLIPLTLPKCCYVVNLKRYLQIHSHLSLVLKVLDFEGYNMSIPLNLSRNNTRCRFLHQSCIAVYTLLPRRSH